MSQLKSAKLQDLINDVFDFDRFDLGVEKKAFSRTRVLNLKVMIFSLLLAAQAGFKQGYNCLMAELLLMGLAKKKSQF